MIRLRCSSFFVGVISLLILSEIACTKKDTVEEPTVNHSKITFTDARGSAISLENPAIKIVSLLPSVTEFVFELDQGHLLIGRSEWCRYPEEALDVEVVGELDDAVDEKLVTLKPDVVLVSVMMPEEEMQQLESLGLKVVVFDHQNWETVLRDLEILGKILGAEGDVKTLIAWLSRKRDIVRREIEALEDSTPVTTAVLYSLEPLYSAGAGTFVDELITLSGGSNIAADLASAWPMLSMEELIQKQPEVILISSEASPEDELVGTIQALGNDPVWSQLPAVKNNRVYIVDGDSLTIPGPRQVVALAQIAAALHPELFETPPQLQHVNLFRAPKRP